MPDRSPEASLADTRWLNRLTRRLVRDPDLADDVRQETLAAALRSPHGTERSWLARVARNLATSMLRREVRRQRHESAASPMTPTPTPPDQLLAEAELQQAAVTALMELDEPYRRTLLLRYMKGLSLRAVAKSMDVPVETVRTRIKRGIVQLRTRLDRRPGGRLALCLPMTVAGWPSPTTTALWGLVIMKTKFLVGVALVAVIASFLGIYVYAGPGDSSPDDPVAIEPLVASSAADPQARTAGEEREVVAGSQSSNEDPVAAPVTGSLLVKVVWEDNREPARNVCVRVAKWMGSKLLRPDEFVAATAITDAAGIVRFDALPVGKRRVKLDRWHDDQNVEIVAGTEARASFQLEPRLSVHGVVVDTQGRAVVGAKILTMLTGRFPWVNVVATSDSEGRFALRGLTKNTYLGARGEDRGVSDFILLLHPKPSADGVRDVRLVLSGESSRLRGRVVDSSGQPVSGAWVMVGGVYEHKDGGWITPPTVHVWTDADGRFAVGDLRRGVCRLRVYAYGHAPLVTEVQVDPFPTGDLELRLEPGATLVGRVFDEAGRGVPGIHVGFRGNRIPLPSFVETDADGRFRVTDLGTGPLRVQVQHEPLGELDQVVQLTAGQVLDHDFKLLKGLTIRGKLVDQRGAPLVGWTILNLIPGSGKLKSATSDEDGVFAISNCADRPHDLELKRRIRRGDSSRQKTIRVLRGIRPGPDSTTYKILDEWLPSAVVRGRVFGSDSKPLADVVIKVKLLEATFWTRAPTTDADGRFDTGLLSPGAYEMTIGHIRHVVVRRKFTLTPNQEHVLGLVVMQARPKKK